ncbi:hypothetical protein ACJX0J_023413, partial [Zea mays]
AETAVHVNLCSILSGIEEYEPHRIYNFYDVEFGHYVFLGSTILHGEIKEGSANFFFPNEKDSQFCLLDLIDVISSSAGLSLICKFLLYLQNVLN